LEETSGNAEKTKRFLGLDETEDIGPRDSKCYDQEAENRDNRAQKVFIKEEKNVRGTRAWRGQERTGICGENYFPQKLYGYDLRALAD
jgi:hypothetical protein